MTSVEKAQKGLALLKEAILKAVEKSPNGLRNADIAEQLHIRSDFLGQNKDYLSCPVIGLLLNENRLKKDGRIYSIA